MRCPGRDTVPDGPLTVKGPPAFIRYLIRNTYLGVDMGLSRSVLRRAAFMGNIRVLIVDDSSVMRKIVERSLRQANLAISQVYEAANGEEALGVLTREKVDLILCDINMPVMDGYGVIRNLRKNPVHKTTPILVLTTESDSAKKVIAREAGATGWMVKPFDPDRLIATIRKVAP